jgi:hypothetical protein
MTPLPEVATPDLGEAKDLVLIEVPLSACEGLYE